MTAVVSLRGAQVRFGERTLFDGLDLDVEPGEFLAVLGPNGGGKSTLLKVLLGLQPLSAGRVEVCGRTPHRGSEDVGYVPQQKGFDRDVPMRGRDLVRLGLDGHRWGPPRRSPADRDRVERAIAAVGATGYADRPLGRLSGGEQQRLRIAQALLGQPRVVLCDEPLLSLDVHHQHSITALIDRQRQSGAAVLFVTHDINPVLPVADRVLYLIGRRWVVGHPHEVFTTEVLSSLYGVPVDVLRVRGRVVVVGTPEAAVAGGDHHPGDAWAVPSSQPPLHPHRHPGSH